MFRILDNQVFWFYNCILNMGIEILKFIQIHTWNSVILGIVYMKSSNCQCDLYIQEIPFVPCKRSANLPDITKFFLHGKILALTSKITSIDTEVLFLKFTQGHLFGQRCRDIEVSQCTLNRYMEVLFLNSTQGDLFGQRCRDIEVSQCTCLLYTSPSPRDKRQSRMPSSA